MSAAGPAPTVVIGGGVIGLAIALTLQRRGQPVLLIDRDAPGQGCSWGNAALIATSFVLPLSSPAHLIAAPRMMIDPLGPLAIRLRDLPATAPWLARFALNALPARQRRTIAGLKALNGPALASWRRLLASAGASRLLHERGMIDVTAPGATAAARSLAASAERLRGEGIRVERLTPSDAVDLEPALAGRVGAALLHPDVAHVEDPALVNDALFEAFLGAGGAYRRGEVEPLSPAAGGVTLAVAGETIAASRVVLCAGYRSTALLGRFGLPVPLGVERGYHVSIDDAAIALGRPVSFHAESFVASPVGGGVRLAGTVELARPDRAPDWRRADLLPRLAATYLPQLERAAGRRWMGRRPSFADSLPAIGRLGSAPLFYAFGHQHLGLTQAATTAEAVAALVEGVAPPFDLAPYALERFDRRWAR